ncbi:exo-beta-N-acetylmuramidase NamZ domain-containing protein, partial [Bacillus pumilus]|uniref:exo-beta-N-acetylmuramidase NamZ domain-containing protein n=1 Tax=Bacillus pumilus TaxID=1408 RepID=UPI00331610D1
MLFGIDVILKDVPFWKEKRIGLITNDAATTINKIKSRVALIDNGFNITKLFSPEHGIAVNAADGSPVLHCTDATTQLPVISLYNEHTKLSAQDLQDIEILLFDVPDVGAR